MKKKKNQKKGKKIKNKNLIIKIVHKRTVVLR